MSPRGGGERTPEEREAARRERERRRYERAGEPVPDHLLEPHERPAAAPALDPEPPAAAYEPAPVEPEPVSFFDEPAPEPPAPQPAAPEPAPPAREPDPEPLQETQQWDVTQAWEDEPAGAADRPREPEPAPAPGQRREPAPGREPEPPAPAEDPDATQLHETIPSFPSQPADAAGPAEPVTGEHEEPLGTRRVSRAHLPHIHRPGRGDGRKRRGGGDLPKGRGVRVKRPGEVMGASRPRRRSAGPRIVAGVVVLIVLALLWFVNGIFQPIGGGGDGSGRVVVRIPAGASAGDVAKLLEERGVVSSAFFFNLRATVGGKRGDLRSGRFTLRSDMSNGAALDALTAAPVQARAPPAVTISIPEGRSRRETRAIAARAGLRGDYLSASRSSRALDPTRYGAPRGATLEGFLFPATYELPRGAKAQRLVDEQLRAFKQNFATIDLRYARSKRLTAFDVLTIASMVEREVSVASERPLVAAVIYNRLRDGIPLGIDATLRFEQNDWINPLKQSVLDADTPYNTRTRQGLPPGPIGSPGIASIRAAARPADSRALYYVVKPGTCGEHAFSDTFERFQADVQRYNDARAAAGGKSPTRC